MLSFQSCSFYLFTAEVAEWTNDGRGAGYPRQPIRISMFFGQFVNCPYGRRFSFVTFFKEMLLDGSKPHTIPLCGRCQSCADGWGCDSQAFIPHPSRFAIHLPKRGMVLGAFLNSLFNIRKSSPISRAAFVVLWLTPWFFVGAPPWWIGLQPMCPWRNSCRRQFMTHSVNSCNPVAIHCAHALSQ